MDYRSFFAHKLEEVKSEGRYRVFTNIYKKCKSYPVVQYSGHLSDTLKDVVMWCSNDYMVMGQNAFVHKAMKQAIDTDGATAGGTRNIAGTTPYHVLLEEKIASWYDKDAALVFTSGYVANFTTLSTLGATLPSCCIYSDAMNHNSMIEGIRHSRAKKYIFKHNDMKDLERLLKAEDRHRAKIIAVESLYSMDGDIPPLPQVVSLAKKYNALTFLDEVHAVGLYGDRGSGMAEQMGLCDDVDIIQGTLGKAIGQIGGFIASSKDMVDFVRSFGAGFIFTTSLPPCVANGAIAAIDYLKGAQDDREKLQQNATFLRMAFLSRNIPIVPSKSHIVSVLVGDAKLCQRVSDMLLSDFSIYVQAINYPTVPRGQERLRFTPTPLHVQDYAQHAGESLKKVFVALNIL